MSDQRLHRYRGAFSEPCNECGQPKYAAVHRDFHRGPSSGPADAALVAPREPDVQMLIDEFVRKYLALPRAETFGEHAERIGKGPCLRCVGKAVTGPEVEISHALKSYRVLCPDCGLDGEVMTEEEVVEQCPTCRGELIGHLASDVSALVAGLRQELEEACSAQADEADRRAQAVRDRETAEAEVAGLRQELHETKESLELADRKVTDAERLLRQSERNRAEDAASHLDEQQLLRDKLEGVLARLRGLIAQWDAVLAEGIGPTDRLIGLQQCRDALEARLDPGRPARSLEET